MLVSAPALALPVLVLEQRREVATDEIASESVSRMHYGEGSGSRVDDKISRFCDGADQSGDQADRFNVRMKAAINLLGPTAGYSAIVPCRPGAQWRLLQDKEIVATPPRPLALALSEVVPGNDVDAFEDVGNSAVVRFT